MIFHCLGRFGNLPNPTPHQCGLATPVCDDNSGICDESEWVLRITQRCLAMIGYDDNHGDAGVDDDG